jgi:N-acyl-D-aspartate/D-glutamate deacylase
VRQGVTTEVVGMCGFSPAPIAPGRLEMVRDWMGGIGEPPDSTWNTFAEYLDHLRALGLSVNVAQFVGHGALRLATAGADARPVTPDEQKQMEGLLNEAMDAGAFGYSTGLVYAPSVFSNTEELIARQRRRRGLYFSTSERGRHSRTALAEAIRIRKAECRCRWRT